MGGGLAVWGCNGWMNEDEKVGNAGWVMFQIFCLFRIGDFCLESGENSRPGDSKVPMLSLSGHLTHPQKMSPAELPGGFVWFVLFFLVFCHGIYSS